MTKTRVPANLGNSLEECHALIRELLAEKADLEAQLKQLEDFPQTERDEERNK